MATSQEASAHSSLQSFIIHKEASEDSNTSTKPSLHDKATMLGDSQMSNSRLLNLPDELLTQILFSCTTPSFIQITLACKKLYDLASDSRDVILHHLRELPGIKLGLDDFTVPTSDLFLLLRQRASKHLYGLNFTADCHEIRYLNSSLNADASCMAELGTDYITISTVLKDSLTVRMYGSKCSLKEKIESPYADGEGKVLQVVHRKHTISVLYQWSPLTDDVIPDMDSVVKPNTADRLNATYPPTDDDVSDEEVSGDKSENATLSPSPPSSPSKVYHLLHYNAYTNDRPYVFTIAQHEDLVPRYITIHSRLHVAILWDKPDYKIHPGAESFSEIVLYTAAKCPVHEIGTYDTKIIWPTATDIRPPVASPNVIASGRAPRVPRKIAFYKEGRRLKIYASGELVPYNVITTGSAFDSRMQANTVAFQNGILFRIDTPFCGHHETYNDEIEEMMFCNLSHLCLGVTEITSIRRDKSFKTLCILRSKTRYEHDDCRHTIDLTRMTHVSAETCRVVACLHGWQEIGTSLTGLDVISVSKLGTRIAVASWKKVYIWSVDPEMLCEDVLDADSDSDEDIKIKKKKKNKRAKDKPKGMADEFYERVKDPYLGMRVAILKPIVIDLQGAVARQMTWTIKEEEEADEQSDSDSESSSDSEQEQEQDSTESIQKSSSEQCMTKEVQEQKEDTVSPIDGFEQLSMQEKTENIQLEPKVEVEQQDESITLNVEPPSPAPQPEKLTHEQDATRSPVKRILSVSRLRQLTINEKLAEADIISLSSIPHPKPSMPNSVVVEPPTSISDNHPKEPKGKEPEMTPTEQDSLSQTTTVSNLTANTPPLKEKELSSEDPDQPTTKEMRHRKRFTEDELTILTDRGIQVWNLGPWSQGLRTKDYLGEK